jgi:hypothetical protein
MKREEFITYLTDTYTRCVEIVKKKNHDYSKDTDPFSNFRAIAYMLGRPVDEVIMMFIVNKISRASNLLHRDNAVKDESVEDTLLDCINYLAILRAYLHGENKSSEA